MTNPRHYTKDIHSPAGVNTIQPHATEKLVSGGTGTYREARYGQKRKLATKQYTPKANAISHRREHDKVVTLWPRGSRDSREERLEKALKKEKLGTRKCTEVK